MKNKLFAFVIMIVMLVIIVGCSPNTIAVVNTPVPNTQSGTPDATGKINVPGFSIEVNAPGQNPLVNTADSENHIAGALIGVWHGIISPVTLVMSFINPNVQMYEVFNDGPQYNLGFLIGVAIVFLILGITAGRRRH